MIITTAEFVKGIRGTDPVMNHPVPHIAFVGRSNVGKSSSMNYLLNRNSLVKTSARPGKTTEINFFKVNDSHYFVDLPGYGFARMGEAQREKLRKLILWYVTEPVSGGRTLVLVLDAKVGLTDYDQDILDLVIAEGVPAVILLNKTDSLNQKETHQAVKQLCETVSIPVIPFSAKKKKGKEALFAEIGLK